MVNHIKSYLNDAGESTRSPLKMSSRPSLIVGGYGDGPTQMKRMPAAVCDSNGRLYVLDDWNHRVLRFTSEGEHLGNWYYGPSVTDATAEDDRLIGSESPPQRIVTMAMHDDELYVTDGYYVWSRHLHTGACATVSLQEPHPHVRALSISPEGHFVLGYYLGPMAVAYRCDGEVIRTFQPSDELDKPDIASMVHDRYGAVWVVLKRYNTIHRLDPITGDVMTTIEGDPPGRVASIIIGSDDLLWARSDRYPRVDRFTLSGEYVDTLDVTDPRGLPSGRGMIAWNDVTHTLIEVDAENACVKWWPTETEVAEVVDVSHPTPDFPATRQPDHITLQWVDDPKTTVAVTWRTSPDVQNAYTVIKPLAGPGADEKDAKTYEGTTDIVPTNLGQLGMHRVFITDLHPDTAYSYKVGSGINGEWSQSYTFRTAPSVNRRIKIGVIGEIHEGGESHSAVADAVSQFDPDFILNTGDIVTRGAHQAQWDEWSHYVGDLPARAPHVVGMGNHDTHRGVISQYYASRFGLPRTNSCPGLEGTVYSFDYGPVHIVALSTTQAITPQTEWLEQDLAANDKPWVIVNMHVPPFTSKVGRENNRFRDTVVPVFTKFGVDLVVSGHDKSYMRTFPMRDQTPLPSGTKGFPVYLTLVSGESFYEVGNFPWIELYNVKETTYGAIEIEGDKLIFTATTIDGKTIDRFVLSK